jgi:hypothetical protein
LLLDPRPQFLPSPCVHADLAASSAFATSDEQSAAAAIEIGFGEAEGFLDAQPGAREDDDPTAAVAGGAHDGDDLLHPRRVGRVAQPLVAWWATGAERRHGRRRPTSTGAIEQQLRHDLSSGS